jgi:rod shape-determining protein MreC
MRNLFYFLAKFGNFILFLLMEVYCIYLIVNYNQAQKSIFINSSNIFSGYLYKRKESVEKFYSLAETADSLAAQNARLMTEIQKWKSSQMQNDTVYSGQDSLTFQYQAAKILKNSIASKNNILLIDKGSAQGLERGMGVISARGIVGIVSNTSQHYATVISLLHSQSKISVAIKNKDYFGTLQWQGDNPLFHSINDIPKHAEIQLGDTVTTSGYSFIFPPNLPIGIVSDKSIDGGSNFYQLQIKLFEDLSKIKYTYVVQNKAAQEINRLLDNPL